MVLCTGGTCTLLDPLQPDRREILLSEFSVVVDTDNVAMSSMARKVLLAPFHLLRNSKHILKAWPYLIFLLSKSSFYILDL